MKIFTLVGNPPPKSRALGRDWCHTVPDRDKFTISRADWELHKGQRHHLARNEFSYPDPVRSPPLEYLGRTKSGIRVTWRSNLWGRLGEVAPSRMRPNERPRTQFPPSAAGASFFLLYFSRTVAFPQMLFLTQAKLVTQSMATMKICDSVILPMRLVKVVVGASEYTGPLQALTSLCC